MHICCGPCAVYPLEQLIQEGFEVSGLYTNPNIHPFTEYQARRASVEKLAELRGLKVIYEPEYQPERFFREVSHREERRCYYCYSIRLEAAARYAKKGKFDAFTSTLLVSRYQNHELIREIAATMAERYEVQFLYRDFRNGFDKGRQQARDMGLYMQKYCGCLYSEAERFAPAAARKRSANKNAID